MIRPYLPTDRPDVERILQALDWPDARVGWHLYTVDRLHNGGPLGAILVSDESNHVVGFVTGEIQTWRSNAQLYAVVVREDRRRSGVGIALLEAFNRFAQGGGASGVDIDVTPGGDKVAIRAFFDHGGYHVSHGFPAEMRRLGPFAADIPEAIYARSLTDR